MYQASDSGAGVWVGVSLSPLSLVYTDLGPSRFKRFVRLNATFTAVAC